MICSFAWWPTARPTQASSSISSSSSGSSTTWKGEGYRLAAHFPAVPCMSTFPSMGSSWAYCFSASACGRLRVVGKVSNTTMLNGCSNLRIKRSLTTGRQSMQFGAPSGSHRTQRYIFIVFLSYPNIVQQTHPLHSLNCWPLDPKDISSLFHHCWHLSLHKKEHLHNNSPQKNNL